jgi:hypothetical protein
MAEKVGLLVVHGIGEQKRFETSRSLAHSILSGLRHRNDSGSFSLVDRSGNADEIAMSCPPIDDAGSPFMISWKRDDDSEVHLHIHEVWWSDLGSPANLREQALFWLWGLGQWLAPVIWKTSQKDGKSNTDVLMLPPTKFHDVRDKPDATKPRPWARFALALSGYYALLTLFAWESVKRLFSAFSSSVSSPSLLTSYIGDVRIYTQAPGKGGGNLTDIGQPWRATIRRRMISQMVAMAERKFTRWYILGHSLGSVVAFNGVQETEWTLPNYLEPAQMSRLKKNFKKTGLWDNSDPDQPVPDLHKMMPRRPTWLGDKDRISRKALFCNFRGLITYGSPLDKFAALWPRIVPVNKQRGDFPAEADWINLSDATDPVGGNINAFESGWSKGTKNENSPTNIRVKASPIYGLAHIQYFRAGKGDRSPPPETSALVNMLFAQKKDEILSPQIAFAEVEQHYGKPYRRAVLAAAWVVSIGILLTWASSLLALALKKLGNGVFATITAQLHRLWPDWDWLDAIHITPCLPEQAWQSLVGFFEWIPIADYLGWSGICATMVTTFVVGLSTVLLAGFWRWAKEYCDFKKQSAPK